MEEFDGKVAVVTGAGSGIGRALAHAFAAEGASVVAADIEAEALAETAESSGTITTKVTDVARYDDVLALADAAFEAHGHVDVLCNNAGVFAGGLIWERPPSDFEWTLAVNLWGILHGIRAFVPRLIVAQRPAHIVNTVSMAGLCSTPYTAPYNVSKFAALAASECLAHDLAAVGAPIDVSVVVPSAVASRIGTSGRNRPAGLASATSDDSEFVEQALIDLTGRGMSPDEAAAIVLDAIRTRTFLVPTKGSFEQQYGDRAAALLARRLPPVPDFD
ncbi:MAG: SDR family NAD(P)-dependent oxidoreductase [Acidimicrobiia bacterium]|jgi:NAD(P)-dependent dehydrogenase (short-subunit alcohol dehydrogenase family)